MKVVTRWPALVPAIARAGHEPVLEGPLEYDGSAPALWRAPDDSVVVAHPSAPPVVMKGGQARMLDDLSFEYGRGTSERDMPEVALTAQPRGARRYPR